MDVDEGEIRLDRAPPQSARLGYAYLSPAGDPIPFKALEVRSCYVIAQDDVAPHVVVYRITALVDEGEYISGRSRLVWSGQVATDDVDGLLAVPREYRAGAGLALAAACGRRLWRHVPAMVAHFLQGRQAQAWELALFFAAIALVTDEDAYALSDRVHRELEGALIRVRKLLGLPAEDDAEEDR